MGDDDNKSSESSLRFGPRDSAEPDQERVPRSRPATPNFTQVGYNESRVDISRGSERLSEEEPEQAAKKMRSEVSRVNKVQDWLGSQITELQKLLEYGAFKAARKEEARGKHCCPI